MRTRNRKHRRCKYISQWCSIGHRRYRNRKQTKLLFIMSREEILQRLENGECTSIKECEQWVRTMNTYMEIPSKLKKGDVFKYTDGFKSRPYIVYKAIGELIISIPISTTKDEMTIHSFNSRFFGCNYFSKSILFVKKREVETRIIGVLDDTKNLNIAYKMIKDLL